MKVKDLITELSKCSQETDVVIDIENGEYEFYDIASVTTSHDISVPVYLNGEER